MANERRLRANLATGIITDNPLTTTTTVVNSASFATLPVVDTATHLPIILNPAQASVPSTNAEIVYVTAHSSGATIATIVRAREGTVASGFNVSTTWVHGPTVADHAPTIVDTSGSLPSTGGLPFKGQLAYISDTGKFQQYTSTAAWVDVYNPGAWTSWTPTLSGGWALGSGTLTGRYIKIGRLVHADWMFTIGFSTTKGTALIVGGLPFAVASTSINRAGAVSMYRVSTNTNYPGQWGVNPSATSGAVRYFGIFADPSAVFEQSVSSAAPFDFAGTDTISGSLTYEASS